MLTYTFNINNNNDNTLNVESIKLSESYNFSDNITCVTITHSDEANITKNDIMSVTSNLILDRNNTYTYSRNFKVIGVNDKAINFNIEHFEKIEILKFALFNDTDKKWVFYFNGKHMFRETDNNITLLICFYDKNGVYIEKVLNNLIYVTPEILHYTVEDDDINNLIEELFINGDSTNFIVKRLNVLYYLSKEEIRFNKNISIGKVSIPIDNSSMTNLETQENIEEYFVEEEVKKSINGIVEMEKDVYHPVYKDKNGNFKDIYKIVFNLHFRQHRGDDWTVGSNVFWNGVDNETVTLNRDFFSYPSGKESFQSDLLSYVNFNDSDVKYQKNRLKKSFIRLSYYDSINNANQNLLNYSTVFLNSGEYFQKYIKHISDKPYKSFIINENNEELKENLIGIKTNREPSSDLTNSNDINVIEEYRLSSQISVTDKYSSTNSSEGFYIYLWKVNSDDVIPKDLYLKIEFNHAGLGRTIPFMYPYDDKNEPHDIKSFEDILNDWRSEDSGYNIKHYNLYSYIHLKYQYDIIKKRYVYYIDTDFYGANNSDKFYDENTNTLYLNIYEVKIDVNAKSSTFNLFDKLNENNLVVKYEEIEKEGGSSFPIFNITDESEEFKYDFYISDKNHIIVDKLPVNNIDINSIYTIIMYKNTIAYIYEWKYINEEWVNINIITFSTLNGYISSRKNSLGYRELLTVKIISPNNDKIIKEVIIYQK